ncbi:MAG: T9SS type A sorting domain-containing protein [candidate division Zixibacteria bacterium]|nr:T9SS type A sorting domain-containing protein [candidate division Zixibacteria bacterium]
MSGYLQSRWFILSRRISLTTVFFIYIYFVFSMSFIHASIYEWSRNDKLIENAEIKFSENSDTVFADFNNDGFTDMILKVPDSRWKVYTNTGDTANPEYRIELECLPSFIAVKTVYLNLDNKIDLACLYASGSLRGYINNSADESISLYSEPDLFKSLSDIVISNITFLDFDVDGDLDLCAETDSQIIAYENKSFNDSDGTVVQWAEENFPNPFSSPTIMSYEVLQEGNVTIKIYDIHGKPVSHYRLGVQKPGSYVYNWDGKNNKGIDMPSGIYFAKLRAKYDIIKKKITFLR